MITPEEIKKAEDFCTQKGVEMIHSALTTIPKTTVKDMLDIIDRRLKEANCYIVEEKISGNSVKESFWRGYKFCLEDLKLSIPINEHNS